MRYLMCFLALLLVPVALSCCDTGGVPNHIPQDAEVINSDEFYVGSNSTDLETFTRGTVFIKKDDSGNYLVQIEAWVEIDTADRGGVAFGIPSGWKVTRITGSYPQYYIQTQDSPDYWPTEWGTEVNIGCMACGGSYAGGQKGSVLMEIESTSKEPNPFPGVFKTSIGVGYEEREGYSVLYPDSKTIELSLLQPVPDLEIALTLDKPPIRGDILQLTCTASLEHWNGQGVSGVTIDVKLPESFKQVDGKLKWSGDIAGGSDVTIRATVKAVEIGEHQISATALYSFSERRYIKRDTIYLGVFDDRGFISDEYLKFETTKSPKVHARATSDVRSVLQLETALSDTPELNKPFEVTCAATALQDVSEMDELSINWDEGFEFLEGNSSWIGGLAKGEQVELTATLVPVKTGRWQIYTQCSGTFHYEHGTQGGSSTGTFTYDLFTIYVFEDGGAVIIYNR